MILSSVQMRWAEVQFYTFCNDIYRINNDMVDLVYAIEAMCRFGKMNAKPVKGIAGKMLADPYYSPSKREIVCLARIQEIPFATIAKMMNVSRQAIHQMLERQTDKYFPTPRLPANEDEIILEFLECVDECRKAGIHL